MIASPTWLRSVLEAWAPPARLGGAEWADAERYLGPEESATPGRWRSLPWQRGILDALADPTVDWIVVLKAAQMGVSELVRCAIGRWALLDPGDVLWVMADEKSANKAMVKLRAMFENTPALRHLLQHDGRRSRKKKDTLKELVLANGMRIVIGWASSPASLASDPFPRVILDETGLYRGKIGKAGSPIGLAEERTKTAGRRRKIVLLSKPEHADDLICRAYDECLDQRERHVPCPECGKLQPLHWERARWEGPDGTIYSAATSPEDPKPRIRLAAYVERTQSAWVECSCGGQIVDVREADTSEASAWLNVNVDEPTRRRAFHVSEFFHWVRGVSDLVARYLRAVKPGDVQNFHTGSLGRPYEQERGGIRAELFEGKAIHAAGVVPSWATILIATADTQKDHVWFMLRAWGAGFRSRLIDWGRVETFEELTRRAFASFPIERTNHYVRAGQLLIDAGGGTAGGALPGSRSQEVYRYAARTPYVTAVKGSGEKRGASEGQPVTWLRVTYGDDKRQTLKVCSPHANYWKDETATLVRSDRWEENVTASDPVYGQHMTGQRQVWEETTQGHGRWVWRKRRGRPDHLWDTAYYQVVGAQVFGADHHEPLLEQQAGHSDHEAYDGGGGEWQIGRRR